MTEFLNSLRDLTSDRIRYANTLSVPAKLPDLGIPSELPELKGKRLTSGSPFLWVGSGGHHTGLHVDRHPNLNFLFCGQKKFWLLPPSLTSQLEIAPLFPDLRLNFRSRVDLREQINGKNSTLSEGCFGCQLGPSDAIYIPAYWWHAVDSNGINVALNYWWEEVTGHTFSSMLLAFSAGLYSFSDAPKSYRDAWFEIFAKLVFRQHGDPYLGLPVDEQGIAGTPNARSKEWLRSESIRCSERLKTICHFKQKTARYGLSEVGRKLDEKGELFLSRADQVLIDVFCKPRHLQDALDLAASSVGPGPALELLQNALEGALIEPQEYSNGKS